MAKSTIKLTKLKGTKSMWTFDESVTDMHGATLGELAKDISEDLVANTDRTRSKMDSVMYGQLVGINEYLATLHKLGIKFGKIFGGGSELAQGTMTGLRKNLNQLSKTIYKFAQPGGPGGVRFNIDHKEVNVALVSLVLIYQYLESVRQEILKDAGSNSKTLSNKGRKGYSAEPTLGIEFGPPSRRVKGTMTDRQLDELIRDVQYSIAASASLETVLRTTQLDGKSIAEVTELYLVGNNYDLTTTKEKVINVAKGAKTVFRVTSKAFNNEKGKVEKYLKRIPFLSYLKGVAGTNRKLFADMGKNFQPGKPKSLSKLKGSNSMSDEIANQMVKTLVGKKTKTYKAKGKKTVTKSMKTNKKSTSMQADIATNAALTARAFKEAARLVGSSKTKKSNNKEKDMALDQREINKLVSRINKRLPAEVRRQMGRPALINRTGRFSNSAKLLHLKATRGGLTGKYSYLLRPYETFENTGERQWSLGYNPKPLIAKSIRSLAQQITKTKMGITLRRA
jgi:hypothetical protein|tara:strand:+ start:414 stop:1940 length:1527 start_codon:yes stop_codon:yes gene_type:complete